MKEFQKSDENLRYIIVINAIDNIFQQKSTDQMCIRDRLRLVGDDIRIKKKLMK